MQLKVHALAVGTLLPASGSSFACPLRHVRLALGEQIAADQYNVRSILHGSGREFLKCSKFPCTSEEKQLRTLFLASGGSFRGDTSIGAGVGQLTALSEGISKRSAFLLTGLLEEEFELFEALDIDLDSVSDWSADVHFSSMESSVGQLSDCRSNNARPAAGTDTLPLRSTDSRPILRLELLSSDSRAYFPTGLQFLSAQPPQTILPPKRHYYETFALPQVLKATKEQTSLPGPASCIFSSPP